MAHLMYDIAYYTGAGGAIHTGGLRVAEGRCAGAGGLRTEGIQGAALLHACRHVV
jgi:hypothetical protein